MAVIGTLPTGRRGSGYINISEYLKQPNMGRSIAQGIGQEADTEGGQVTQGINEWESGANQAVAAGMPSFDPNAAAQIINSVSVDSGTEANIKGFGGSELNPDISQGIQTPTVSMPTLPTSPKYTGSRDFTQTKGYGDVLGATNAFSNELGQLDNPYSVGEIIKEKYATSPTYSKGMKALDTAYTMGSGGDILQGTKSRWSGIKDYLGGKEARVQRGIEGAISREQEVSKQWADVGAKAQKTVNDTNAYYKKIADERLSELKGRKDQYAKTEASNVQRLKDEKAAAEAAQKAEEDRVKGRIADSQGRYIEPKDRAAVIAPGGYGQLWSKAQKDHFMATGEDPSTVAALGKGYSTGTNKLEF